MEWLSDRAGIPIVELPFTVGGAEGIDDLFDLFEVTITRLEEVHDQH
jgi:zinc/manganese transport system substrate-binding protein